MWSAHGGSFVAIFQCIGHSCHALLISSASWNRLDLHGKLEIDAVSFPEKVDGLRRLKMMTLPG